MGASAQNCSGVGWRRRRVRFNEILEKVPKVPEKVWDALLQSRVKFNFYRESGQVQQGSGEVAEEGSGRFWYRSKLDLIGFQSGLGGFGTKLN